MSPEPFDSRAEALPAKRWEKGYGDENGAARMQRWRMHVKDQRAICDWTHSRPQRSRSFWDRGLWDRDWTERGKKKAET